MSIDAWKEAREAYIAAQDHAADTSLAVVDVVIRADNGTGTASRAFNDAVAYVLQQNFQTVKNQALAYMLQTERGLRPAARAELNALLADAQD